MSDLREELDAEFEQWLREERELVLAALDRMIAALLEEKEKLTER